MSYKRRTRDEHFTDPGPKRILAMDGGGLRGIVTLAYLEAVEKLLRARHGDDPGFRLAHYFDLIAGTSTGSIIAAALALGFSVEELIGIYLELGDEVFRRSLFRKGIVRSRYDEEELSRRLKEVFGEDTGMGSDRLQTGVLVVTKRMDTGSPWPLGNNPSGAYFEAPEDASWISNSAYPLWKVVRASTAAPSFFDPEQIVISEQEGKKTQVGNFVDGGVSPFNNPTLIAFMYATLQGFRVGWETGPDDMLILSVGTGRGRAGAEPSPISAVNAVQALVGLMDDCGALVETLVQWMSESPTAREIDAEIGDLEGDLIGPGAQFTYMRYDLALDPDSVRELDPGVPDEDVESLTEMDIPENMPTLLGLGRADAERKVSADHFPDGFDLT